VRRSGGRRRGKGRGKMAQTMYTHVNKWIKNFFKCHWRILNKNAKVHLQTLVIMRSNWLLKNTQQIAILKTLLNLLLPATDWGRKVSFLWSHRAGEGAIQVRVGGESILRDCMLSGCSDDDLNYVTNMFLVVLEILIHRLWESRVVCLLLFSLSCLF
jgi:hypothetical protein